MSMDERMTKVGSLLIPTLDLMPCFSQRTEPFVKKFESDRACNCDACNSYHSPSHAPSFPFYFLTDELAQRNAWIASVLSVFQLSSKSLLSHFQFSFSTRSGFLLLTFV